jgi:hypothetical protein
LRRPRTLFDRDRRLHRRAEDAPERVRGMQMAGKNPSCASAGNTAGASMCSRFGAVRAAGKPRNSAGMSSKLGSFRTPAA